MAEETMHVTAPNDGNSGIHWGGNGGNGSSSSNNTNLKANPEKQAGIAFGLPATISVIEGGWGITLFGSQPLQTTVQAALSRLEQGLLTSAPIAGRLIGIAGLLAPTSIAKENFTPHIISALPAERVTSTPINSLPLQSATVVQTRIIDAVDEGKQKIAVMGTKMLNMQVPVVTAKPTKTKGVFTATVVPGMPDLHIKVEQSKPSSLSPVAGPADNSPVKGAPFTAGGNTYDTIVRFPDNSSKPVYISVSKIMTEAERKKVEAEENKRQAEWDSRHPVEVAERKARLAADKLARANQQVAKKQTELNQAKAKPDYLTTLDPVKYPAKSQSKVSFTLPGSSVSSTIDMLVEVKDKTTLNKLLTQGSTAFALGPVTAPTQEGLEYGKATARAYVAEYEKLRQRLLTAQKSVAAATSALTTAMQSKSQSEKEKKDADIKVSDEKSKAKGKQPELKFDEKIKTQMGARGWSEKDVRDAVAKGAKGRSVDQRRPNKTPPDYLGRNDTATVYGQTGKYVVVNDRTGEVTQVSDRNDAGWVDDSRIKWGV